jgi:DNA-binding transcriptional MerR regulator
LVTKRTSSKAYLRSGELAEQAGVSTDTLRHYERKGLIPAPRRSQNGYREYPANTLDRVRLVRRALTVGFTLDELIPILRERDKGGAPCRQVRALTAMKLEKIEEQLKQIGALRDELHGLLIEWDSLLESTAPGQPVRLLESLSSSPRIADRRLSPLYTSAFQNEGKRRR